MGTQAVAASPPSHKRKLPSMFPHFQSNLSSSRFWDAVSGSLQRYNSFIFIHIVGCSHRWFSRSFVFINIVGLFFILTMLGATTAATFLTLRFSTLQSRKRPNGSSALGFPTPRHRGAEKILDAFLEKPHRRVTLTFFSLSPYFCVQSPQRSPGNYQQSDAPDLGSPAES